ILSVGGNAESTRAQPPLLAAGPSCRRRQRLRHTHMHHSIPGLAPSGSDELIARRTEFEQPEFDITAMVDLVFMMNIYFLVTFITVSLGGIALPTAKHVSALDAESAVILTVVRTLDGKSVNLYLGDGEKGEPIKDVVQQEKRIQEAVEQGVSAGKTA